MNLKKNLLLLKRNKKGEEAINTLIGFGIGIVVVFFIFVVGSQVFSDISGTLGVETFNVSFDPTTNTTINGSNTQLLIMKNGTQLFLNSSKLGPVLGTIAMIVVMILYILRLKQASKNAI